MVGRPMLDVRDLSVARGLSLLPEVRGLFPAMTVEENLVLGGPAR
ncbi:MAG TPA: hypothetical protein VGV13_11210 [Methylomirabilota bacterium]|jgi:ABC-type branched-subunit amino acid transport system ATPase component|nr:hypothetical protein [Methylomirabilota bacterium]